MSIRNGKAREGAFDASQSCLNLYWKISDNYFLVLLKNISQKAVPTKASAEERCDGEAVILVRLAGIEPTTLGFGGQYSIH